MKKKNKIKRSDYARVLITETLPYETPIIFSNDGLYDRINSVGTAGKIEQIIVGALVFGEGLPSSVHSTSPYHYKIKKNSKEFRRLALLHPLSQWKVKSFYQKYEKLLIHYCSVSPSSIRAPSSVASSFYNKSSWENINQYKTVAVAVSGLDRYVKHAPSFFSYRGYDRLYKFFISRDYFSLEKSFSILATLDVSKCFDSIYTHSLSWAVKDKPFTKEHVSISSTFAQEFDQVIRHGNHNETNGIPIGPEVSRIFSEIVFQEIDRQVIDRISKMRYGVDYTFRRYVDDVFIFADNEAASRNIYDVYSDVLVSFNLHANASKSSTSRRPFVTTKSRLIHEAGKNINDFIGKFLVEQSPGTLVPTKIYSQWKLTKSYIDSIKSLCSYSDASYDEVASFLISVLTERIKKLVNNEIPISDPVVTEQYLRAIEVLLDVLFFLYSVAPSVGASYKLSTSIILLYRFTSQRLSEHTATVSQQIYDFTSSLLLDQCGGLHGDGVDGFIHLECLNIVLAIRELGDSYLLPQRILDELFIKDKSLSYFTIISCLFYIRTNPQYSEIRKTIFSSVNEKLSDLSDVLMNSEKAHLLLDMLSCPFIPQKRKNLWVNRIYKLLKKPSPTAAEISTFTLNAHSAHWQIDWNDVDLLNSLEKKELKQAY